MGLVVQKTDISIKEVEQSLFFDEQSLFIILFASVYSFAATYRSP